MAWKWLTACPRCQRFGISRSRSPCSSCTKRSTFDRPRNFKAREPPKGARPFRKIDGI